MEDDLKKLIDFTGVSLSDLGLAEGTTAEGYRYASLDTYHKIKNISSQLADKKKIDINQPCRSFERTLASL